MKKQTQWNKIVFTILFLKNNFDNFIFHIDTELRASVISIKPGGESQILVKKLPYFLRSGNFKNEYWLRVKLCRVRESLMQAASYTAS